MNWEDLEALYWRFDAMHKGYGEFAGSSTSERDAFKRTVKQALAEKNREIELADYTIKECLKKLSQQDTAYQQLMVEAEFFAKAIIACLPDGLPPVTRSKAFLKERVECEPCAR